VKTRLTILSFLLTALCLPATAPAFDFKKLDLDKMRQAGEKLKPLRELSESDEIEMGRGVAANLLGAAPLVNDPPMQAYVNRIGKWLAMHSERPNLPWRFGVLDTNGVNAFATPGGYVFITRGMLVRCRDEAELAGILAHEISHVVERHALNTMRKGALVGLAGDAFSEYAAKQGKESLTKLVSAGTEIFTRGLDKEDEFAADRLGVVIAARAGYDPYGLPGVLQTLASINPKDDAVALMFKTHPDPGKRLELITGVMEGRLDQYVDAPTAAARFVQMTSKYANTGTKNP